jgi:hypothetical protein
MVVIDGTRTLLIGAGFGLSLAVAGCGGDAEVASGGGVPNPSSFAEDPEAAGSDLVEAVEGAQGGSGAGSATLTVGKDVYTFTTVRCAIGSDATGNADFDFSLSSIQDGMQLSIDTGPTYGDEIMLDDIKDFENPEVGWHSQGDGFLTIDGKNVSGEAEFVDSTVDFTDKTVSGSIVATCP